MFATNENKQPAKRARELDNRMDNADGQLDNAVVICAAQLALFSYKGTFLQKGARA